MIWLEDIVEAIGKVFVLVGFAYLFAHVVVWVFGIGR